jgi:tetratricopeptide (TPR) repeat protein/DNA-binding response OmpR family regulator
MIAAIPMGSPRDGVEPTVLLVGAGERFTPAFQAALGRHRVFVETAELVSLMDAVVVTAPDLVLLMGDAARDGGASVLEQLRGLSQNFSVPVVVLNDDAELGAKLTAFEHGAAAVLPRSASVDATAEQVARLARDLPERGRDSQGDLGEATLDEFVNVLSKRLREGLARGLLPEGVDNEELRLVLGQGRPLIEFVDGFVRRVRRHVVRAEPLRYELDMGGDAGAAPFPVLASQLEGLCVLLADDDTVRADTMAQELRARGAAVLLTDLEPNDARFQALRQADPAVLVIGEGHAHGGGYALLRKMRRDSRLRWVPLLVVRWEDVWPDQRAVPAIQRLQPALLALVEPQRALLSAAEAGMPFETRLEATGPARCLRTLASASRALRIHVEHARVELSIDLSDGLVVGVEGRTLGPEPKPLAGVSALSALLVLGSGRVRVEVVDRPASANVMAPPEVALSMADAETPPISPSIPAAAAFSLPPTLPRAPDAPPTSLRPLPVVPVGVQPPRPAPPRPSPTSLKPTPVVAVSSPTAPVTSIMPSPAPISDAAEPNPTPPAPTPSPSSAPTSPPPPPATTTSPLPPQYGYSPRAIPPSIGALRSKPPPAPTAVPVESNPPAMTLSPGRGGSSRPSHAPPGVTPSDRGLVKAASVWLAKQEAKLHGKRIPRSTAAALVGLGMLHGLLLVGLYAGARSVLSRASGEPALARAAEAALTRPETAPPRTLPPATSATAALAMAPASAAPAGTSGAAATQTAATATAPADGHTADGSNHSAPACRDLLAENPPKAGFDPVAALAEMRAARTAIVRGDLRAAQLAFCRAAEFDPKKGEVALQLTHVLLLVRDGPQAVEWAERAVQQLPRQRKAKETLGDALARVGAHAEARAAWSEGAGIDATNSAGQRALVMRGLKDADRTLRARDYVAAERYFRRAAVLDPSSLPAITGLAYVLGMLGDAGAAAIWARRAVETNPRSAAAHFALGDALQKAGDDAGATAAFREATTIDPNHREASRRLRALGGAAK